MSSPSTNDPVPWWRVGMVWLVVGGPALAVAASFASLALAVHGADTPLLRDAGSTPPSVQTATTADHAEPAHR